MNIQDKYITVKELVAGFEDSNELGVVAFGGNLNVRPAYQREFIYSSAQQVKVIESILSGFPLGSIHWAQVGAHFEIIDGQQRTLSICNYVRGDFAVNGKYYINLLKEELDQLLNYRLNIHVCVEGTDAEKLSWFETINISGERLTAQELRNALYSGPWLADAKRYFSKSECAAEALSRNYIPQNKRAIRQEILELAIDWVSNGKITTYMGLHQQDVNAKEFWDEYNKILTWIKTTFPTERTKLTPKVDWGTLYHAYKDTELDPVELETQLTNLINEDDSETITNLSGIYPYVLTKNERHLSLRKFDDKQRTRAYERQKGICPKCGKKFKLNEMEADHITPWCEGGKTIDANLQLLCKHDNRIKSNI